MIQRWEPRCDLPRLLRWAVGVLFLTCRLATAGVPIEPHAGPELRPALRVVGLQEGLPALTVYSIAKDAEERLWVGTQFGVARFSGQRWEPVTFPGAIQPSVVRAIVRGTQGELWFATDNLGAWRLFRGQWTHFGPPEGLPTNRVNALWVGTLDGRPGQVLIGTTRGLLRLEGARFQPFDPGPGVPAGAWVWKIRDDPEGNLWVAARGWIAQRANAAWKLITASEGLPAADVNDLEWLPRPGGPADLVVAIWNKGIFTFRDGRWSPLHPGAGSSLYPTCLRRTPDPAGGGDILWVATYDTGLSWFRNGRWYHLDQEKGFPSGGIYSLFPDSKPTLWAGTRNGGMVALDLLGWSSIDRSLGLPSNEITALLPTLNAQGQPEAWAGTSKGLAHWEKGRWTLHTLDSKAPDYINSLLETREGASRILWVGTLRGLVRFDGRTWTRLDPKTTTRDPQVFRLRSGRAPHGEPVLWAGTQWGLASLRKGVWASQTQADGLPHDWIFDLIETECTDGELDIWVATRGGGVGRFHQGKWHTPRQGITEGGDLVATCLKEARGPDGTRWLFAGTQGRGLMRLSLDHPETPWTFFNEANLPGLSSQGISAMEVDVLGRLFLGTPKGIVRLTLGAQGRLEPPAIFGRADGLPNLSISLGSLARGPEGRLWVGTVEGIGVLEQGTVDPEPWRAPTLVDWVDASGAIQDWVDGRVLPHRQNHLNLRLSLPLSHHFEEVQFRTQLVGLEKDPSPWSPEALREYPVLPSGNHLLRIWAKDHLGRETPPRDLSFRVEAPPWRRPWALAAYLLGLGLLVWGALSFRLRMLTRRNAQLHLEIYEATEALVSAKTELEDKVRERTQQLGLALEEAKAADHAKSAFLARMSHELRTPLNQMQLIAQLVRDEWKEATGKDSSPDIDAIQASGRRLEELISDLLDFSALEAGNLELHPAPFDLSVLLTDIRTLYGPLARAKGFRLEVAVDTGLPFQVVGDRTRLAQVLKDLVSNAIKFTEHGAVELRVRPGARAGDFRIEVDDTGPGIAPEALPKVFGPFEQQDGALNRRHGGTGLGLAIAKRLMKLMGGSIGFESRPEGGTRFWIEIPLPPVGA